MAVSSPDPNVAFDNLVNFRDVGKTVNQFLNKKLVVEGRLYRSARPDDATPADRTRLQAQYKIKTIMDLRTVTEHANRVKKRNADLRIPALVQSNAALAGPLQIPGMNYLEININGRGFEKTLLWRLSFWSFMKLLVLMLLGYRMQAIAIMGREVMQPRGLIGIGYDSIDSCGPEIAEALRAFTAPQTYGILVHCTQGKDRTGLIIMLLLLILEVPVPAIAHDYLLSEPALLPEREERMKEIREIGLTDDFAGCPPRWIEQMTAYLDEKHGGVGGYLESIGFGEQAQDEIRAALKM